MEPTSRSLPNSSHPRSSTNIDPALAHQQPALNPPPSLPSHEPSFSTAPEEPSHSTATASSSPHHSFSEEASEPFPPSIPPPPPNFAPYFTLLSSHPTSEQGATHHPAVHYIFADDPLDNSPVADAALDVLDPAEEGDGEGEGARGEEATAETRRGGSRKKERYVLLDMDESGTKVRSAKSMSPDWAVTGAEVSMAPTWEGDGGGGGGGGTGGSEAGGGGWMLKIEGVEALGVEEHEERKREERGLEELMVEYERSMGELKRVVGAGAESGGGAGDE